MHPAEIDSFLTDRDIRWSKSEESVWSLSLAGEFKKAIGCGLALGESGLRMEAFFMRAPVENADAVYRLLLARNSRARLVWFAVDAAGDVYLLGYLPAAALSRNALDELLGELLTTADQMFNAAIERGFERYLAHDLAWRAKQHGP